MTAHWSEWFPQGEDGDPPSLTLAGTFGPHEIPALIARLQDFHLRAAGGAPAGLLSIPGGRIYPGDDYPMFAQHPGIEGWLLLGRADQLPPGALVQVHRRRQEPAPARVLDWVASRSVSHRDGVERLWVMARFERVMPADES